MLKCQTANIENIWGNKMSTNIKTITGRYAESYNGDYTANYDDSNIILTRFCDGSNKGTMLQIIINNNKESAYTQLTQKQVKELAEILKESFDYSKYPSD